MSNFPTKFPRYTYKRYQTVKNSDTNTVETVYLFFDWDDGEVRVQVHNVSNKKEAWSKYYSELE
jgi:hypothetical protein